MPFTLPYERQKYIDIPFPPTDELARRYQLDCVQLKYDGIWSLAVVNQDGSIRHYSRTGQLKHSRRLGLDERIPVGIFVGELMFGTQWSLDTTRAGQFFVFDCLESGHQDIAHWPYRKRVQVLQHLKLPEYWVRVPTFPFAFSDSLWLTQVVPHKYEGLVYRSSFAAYNQEVFRSKPDIEMDLYIVGFNRGEGKYSDTLGALVLARQPGGEPFTTCSGMTDQQRHAIWRNHNDYMNCCVTITCKKVFDSGKPRHPQFKCIHADKEP